MRQGGRSVQRPFVGRTTLPSPNASVAAPSAQVRVRATVPLVAVGTLINPPSAQVRVYSELPAIMTTSSSLDVPSAQVLVRSVAPSDAGSATVVIGSAQIRVRTAAPNVSTTSGASVSTPSAQVRARGATPTITAGASATTPSAQLRVRTNAPFIVAGLSALPPSAQVRLRTSTPAIAISETIAAPSARVIVRTSVPSVSLTTPVVVAAPSAQTRIRASIPALSETSNVLTPSAGMRIRSSVPAISTSANLSAPSPAQVRIHTSVPILIAQPLTIVNAPAAQARVHAVAPQVSTSTNVIGASAQIRISTGTPTIAITSNPIPTPTPPINVSPPVPPYTDVRVYVGDDQVPREIKNQRRSTSDVMRFVGTPVLLKRMYTPEDADLGNAQKSPNMDSTYKQPRHADPLSYGVGYCSIDTQAGEWYDPATGALHLTGSLTPPDPSYLPAPRYRGYGPGFLTYAILPDRPEDVFKITTQGVMVRTQNAKVQLPWWPLVGDNDLMIVVDLDDAGRVNNVYERYQLKMVTPITMRGQDRRGRRELTGANVGGNRFWIGQECEAVKVPTFDPIYQVETDR